MNAPDHTSLDADSHSAPTGASPSEASTPPLTEASPSSSPAPTVTPGPHKPPVPSFADLGVRPEVLRALDEMGFSEPMEVQAATLPHVLAGRDLMVQSRTGSGKTAAFGIPFFNGLVDSDRKAVQAIVLLPTRELALQVAAELAKIGAHSGIVTVPVYGGAPMGRQVEQLRAGGQVVCGTPGRVLDHLRRGTLKLDSVRCAVLDECDEMLSMGFQEDIEAILERTPSSRQTLLFSATVPEGIQRLSGRFLRSPEMLKLSADFVGVHEIRHVYYSIPGVQREQELLRVLEFENPARGIVFCNTRDETARVAEFLRQKGFDAEAISSDLSQSDRERVMGRMRAGNIRFLVATDVAARGIDIENLSHVFNYTFPEAPEIYIHRTGRTGRAGKHGTAISLIGPTEVGSFYYLKLLYKIMPEERALPSEIEIRSRREGEQVLTLRGALPDDPGASWRALARRLMGAPDGERLVASLLARAFGGDDGREGLKGLPPAPPPPPAARPAATEIRQTSSSAPPSSRTHGGDSSRRPPLREGRDSREPRRDRSSRDSGRRRPGEGGGESGGSGGGHWTGRRPRGGADRPLADVAGAEGKEFWEMWSEEKMKATATDAPPTGAPALESDEWGGTPTTTAPVSPKAPEEEASATGGGPGRGGHDVPEGMARLYLNLGRKDGAGEAEIAALLSEHAGLKAAPLIDVMNTHTYLNVAADQADRICAALTGKQVGNRALVAERARPRRPHGRGRPG